MPFTAEQRNFFKELYAIEDAHEAGKMTCKQALDATIGLLSERRGVDFGPFVGEPLPEAWLWMFDGHVPELEFVKTTDRRKWLLAGGDIAAMWKRALLYATALEFLARLEDFEPMLDSIIRLDDGTTCIVITGGYPCTGNTFVVCITDGYSPFLAIDCGGANHTIVRLTGGAPDGR